MTTAFSLLVAYCQRSNGPASQFPDDPGLWPPLRRAMISTAADLLPRFPVRTCCLPKVRAAQGATVRRARQPNVRPCAHCALCLPPEVLPDFPARRPAPDYGLNLWPERATAASALLRRVALQCYLQTVHTHETLPPRTPPRALVIFGKGQQRAAASCLELRAGFLGNLSSGGARWETLGRVGAPGPWWQQQAAGPGSASRPHVISRARRLLPPARPE